MIIIESNYTEYTECDFLIFHTLARDEIDPLDTLFTYYLLLLL